MKPNSFFQTAFTGTKLNYAKNLIHDNQLINFGSGEVDLPVSKLVVSAIKQVNSKDLMNYPDPICRELKAAVATRYGVDESQVAVGNGSDEIIENIPRVFIEPGDKCLFIVPTFFRYIESCQKMKAKIITVATREEDGFTLTPSTLTKIKKAIEKHQPKIVWIDSPNSITGAVVPFQIILQIISWSKGLVVVDEVHHELADPENHQSAISLLPKHRNLIVIKSVSKAFGLAGARLGFALANQEIISHLEQWRLTFAVNSITQKAAIVALSDKNHIAKIARLVKAQRQKLLNKIEKIPGLTIGSQSQTHLFILKHQKLNLFDELITRGILAADMRHAPGLENKGFVRLNIKTPKQSRILLKALSSIYNQTI